MTDGQAAQPPHGAPSTRALGAMESAVRRAREAAGGGSPPSPPPRRRPPPAPAPAPSPTPSPGSSHQADRWLIVAVAVVSVLIVAAGIGLAASLATHNGPPRASATSTSVTSPGHSGGSQTSHQPSSARGGGHPAGTSDSTTTSAAPAAPGAAPVISALSLSSGDAGEVVQVAGSNFLSSNGHIVATFNGQVASTSCPAQNTCTVTVPPSTGSPSAQVTITTASGTSNAVTFTYG